jgi:hypothetical protein
MGQPSTVANVSEVISNPLASFIEGARGNWQLYDKLPGFSQLLHMIHTVLSEDARGY